MEAGFSQQIPRQRNNPVTAGDPAPLIAIVGADGSGKSTLAPDLLAWLRQHRPAQGVYLGTGSSPIGESIKSWPLIGPAFERFLARKADRARDPKERIPGTLAAIVIYYFSLRRRARFRAMLDLRRRGVAVVTDRYPQVDVPGFYDGPGLSAARAEGWLVKRLAARERAIFAEMVAWLPSIVLRLNVDLDVALARKPDHRRALVARKVTVTPQLRFNGAPIAEIDANQPYDRVLSDAKDAVSAAGLAQPK